MIVQLKQLFISAEGTLNIAPPGDFLKKPQKSQKSQILDDISPQGLYVKAKKTSAPGCIK